jgi:hypothetical protein
MKNRFPLLSPAQVGSGQYSGVFIDDTGAPGHHSPTIYLHPDRKTWVAVLLTHEQLVEAYQQMPRALEELHQSLGIREFHFAELLSGKGTRDVPFDVRLAVFRFMAYIFSVYRYPILVQTFSPENIAEHQELLESGGAAGPFDLTDPTDLSLLFLLWQIRHYFADNRSAFPRPAVVFTDEGRFKARMAVTLGPLLDYAAFQALFVRSSADMFFLQLADFAAFAINRMQWSLAKEERTDKDNTLIKILGEAHLNVINIPTLSVDLSSWTTAHFEALHIQDRKAKGLSPLPGNKKLL